MGRSFGQTEGFAGTESLLQAGTTDASAATRLATHRATRRPRLLERTLRNAMVYYGPGFALAYPKSVLGRLRARFGTEIKRA